MLDKYTKVVVKILKGEWLATATDEEGSSRVMSEIMPLIRTGHCLPTVAPRETV